MEGGRADSFTAWKKTISGGSSLELGLSWLIGCVFIGFIISTEKKKSSTLGP
jgi:hypothetical protein